MRFLTKRFIGDYEPNTGSLYSRLVRLDGEQVAVHIQDTPGCLQVRAAPAQTREDRGAGGRKSLAGGSQRFPVVILAGRDVRLRTLELYRVMKPCFGQIWLSALFPATH